MAPVFEKMNLKDQREILVVNAPASFETELASFNDVVVHRDPGTIIAVDFALVFATHQADARIVSSGLHENARNVAVDATFALILRKCGVAGIDKALELRQAE